MPFQILLTHKKGDLEFFFGEKAIQTLSIEHELVFNDSNEWLKDKDVMKIAPNCHVIISEWWTGAGAELLTQNKNLLAFVRCGVEINNVDMELATQEGILVVNTLPTPVATAVSEFTLGQIIMLARNIEPLHDLVDMKKLCNAYDFSVSEGKYPAVYPGFLLKNEILGLIGLGAVGMRVAKLANAFGMKVVAHDPNVDAQPDDVELVELNQLLKIARFVSLHANLTEETKQMIGMNELNLMRPDAFIVNTARGALIDNHALAKALHEKKIQGAALDVFEDEPDFSKNPLLECEHVILTPHVAGLTETTIVQQAKRCVEIVNDMLKGNIPESVVNKEVIAHARIQKLRCGPQPILPIPGSLSAGPRKSKP